MALIQKTPDETPTVAAIYRAIKAKESRRLSRRLGASIVGKECERAVWYDFRWAARENFDGRTLRLFQTGNLAEIRFIHELRDIGCEVHEIDPETKQQIEFSGISGHLVCKIDAAVIGLPEAKKAWHVCEFKTHNAKSFARLKSDGLDESKPQHLAQLLIGMHLSGIDRGLYLASNKDNDELYSERVRIEDHRETISELMTRAESIVGSSGPPPRIAVDADNFYCRFCSHKEHCHGASMPVMTCRSCLHATPVVENNGAGRWVCEKHNRTLSAQEQARGCEDHLFITDMLAFASLVDAGEDEAGFDYVLYRAANGREWKNTTGPGGYRSIELTQLSPTMIADKTVDELKREFGAVVIGADDIPF